MAVNAGFRLDAGITESRARGRAGPAVIPAIVVKRVLSAIRWRFSGFINRL